MPCPGRTALQWVSRNRDVDGSTETTVSRAASEHLRHAVHQHGSRAAVNTLPDAVREGLRALAVGINPSLPSVRAGFCFANPRNRFWPALNASRLVDAPLEPGPGAVAVLVERYGIGFTDIVKRPTAGSGELRPREFRDGAVRLEALILRLEPGVVWFQGAMAWRAFARHAGWRVSGEMEWGAQERRIGASAIFVTPNPSPANAAHSLAALVRWFDGLADFLPRVRNPADAPKRGSSEPT